MNPFTVSAGHVTHQPTKPTVRSLSEKKFQSAPTRRSVDGVGIIPLCPGTRAMKCKTPCLSGSLPVAIDVQSTGDHR